MAKTREQKNRKNEANNRKRKLGLKPPQKNPNPEIKEKQKKPKPKTKTKPQSNDPILFGPNSSDSDADDSSPDVQKLLEPYTKDQLVVFLCDAALADGALLDKIRSVADRDVSHRKVFVHGLSWDTTQEALVDAFSPFGSIEDCKLVVDKATGRAKGYGFVLFKTRSGAAKALAQPQKKINNRIASCQLASLGPTAPSPVAGGDHADTAGRKIYVSNVHPESSPDKLKAFFEKFGEIEAGPLGLDFLTGKSRGFALFVYKTQEAARKVLEVPYKMFEGHQLRCQWATEASKGKDTAAAGLVGSTPQQVLAAVAAAQNLALYGQNPAYGALLAQNPMLTAAGALNPGGLNPAALNSPALNPVVGLAGYGGSPSVFGVYGTQGTAPLQGTQYGPEGLQGTQYGTVALQGTQYGTEGLQGTQYGTAALRGTQYGTEGLQGMQYGTAALRGTQYGIEGLQGMQYGTAALRGTQYGTEGLPQYGTEGLQGMQYGTAALRGTQYGTEGLQGTQYGTAALQGTQYGMEGLQGTRYETAGLQGMQYGMAGLQGTQYATAGLQGMQYGSSPVGRQGGSYGGVSSHLW